jgi:hypothetical protein
MHYYDSRGVSRVYEISIDADSWHIWQNTAGFSQRFNGMAADGGDAILGGWQLCRDDSQWNDDLQITYEASARSDRQTALPLYSA